MRRGFGELMKNLNHCQYINFLTPTYVCKIRRGSLHLEGVGVPSSKPCHFAVQGLLLYSRSDNTLAMLQTITKGIQYLDDVISVPGGD